MSTVWQKFRNSTGVWQSLSLVTNVFNRRSYRDLDSDTGDKEEDVGPQAGRVDQDDKDQPDAGIGRRRKYNVLLTEIEQSETVSKFPESGDDINLWRENNRNELIETKAKWGDSLGCDDYPQIFNHTESSPTERNQTEPCPSEGNQSGHCPTVLDQTEKSSLTVLDQTESQECDPSQNVNQNKESKLAETGDSVVANHVRSAPESRSSHVRESRSGRRPRRDSYDKALAEMRDSYDRVFRDVIDSIDTPPVIQNNTQSNAILTKDTLDQTSPEDPTRQWHTVSLDDGYGSQSSHLQDNVSKTPFHRQLSPALQKEIPGAIHVIRQKSYSKLGDDPDEIVDISRDDGQCPPDQWHESFPVKDKKKILGRKRSKKVWKKTKKAVRVTWKWLRRSLIAYNSFYHYGIPMNVAMYGGSRRQGRPKFYDYR